MNEEKKNKKRERVFSGASPEKVAEDLAPLIHFKEQGMPFSELRALLEKSLFPHLMNYAPPQFQSMFNILPEPGAKFGAVLEIQYNQGVTNWQVSPGGAMLEELCAKALCQMFGLPMEADATFMYCGTYANLQALFMALQNHAEKQGFDLNQKGITGFKDPEKLFVLCSEDAHFSLKHAVRSLGLGEKSLVPVKVDQNRRMDVSHFQQKIDQLGRENIFCSVATAGTTSTGSIDPLSLIAEISINEDIWIHIDGAYGLAYSLVAEWEPLFQGKELANSVSWDPHKQFGVPIPNSVLFVKNEQDFERMALFSDYFNPAQETHPNPGLKSAPSTRPFSALPLITSILHQGLKKIRQRLRSPLDAVKKAALQIESEPELELCLKPDTGILCFQVVPNDLKPNKINDLQEYIYEEIMSKGERTLSKTKIGDKTALRLVAVSTDIKSKHLLETAFLSRNIARTY
jgi:L-2,4-diaminobutyrate decarboxylase